MSEHVLIRKLENISGTQAAPRFSYGIETREAAGPVHKQGAFPDDVVWLKLHGGLVVGKAKVQICWVGEYSSIAEIRARTQGSPLHDDAAFWARRPKSGYAAVVTLEHERWVEPHWAGPRTYGYEWVILDKGSKRDTWLETKPPPKGGSDLLDRFNAWRQTRP